MTKINLEKALLFMQCYQEASHLGYQAMCAIAFALRNRRKNGWEGGDWMQVIQNCNRLRYNEAPPNKGFPDLRDPILHKFLAKVDSIYDDSEPDLLTSCTQFIKVATPLGLESGLPTGVFIGKWWADLSSITNQEFLEKIVRRPTEHPKTSTVGMLTFYA